MRPTSPQTLPQGEVGWVKTYWECLSSTETTAFQKTEHWGSVTWGGKGLAPQSIVDGDEMLGDQGIAPRGVNTSLRLGLDLGCGAFLTWGLSSSCVLREPTHSWGSRTVFGRD